MQAAAHGLHSMQSASYGTLVCLIAVTHTVPSRSMLDKVAALQQTSTGAAFHLLHSVIGCYRARFLISFLISATMRSMQAAVHTRHGQRAVAIDDCQRQELAAHGLHAAAGLQEKRRREALKGRADRKNELRGWAHHPAGLLRCIPAQCPFGVLAERAQEAVCCGALDLRGGHRMRARSC